MMQFQPGRAGGATIVPSLGAQRDSGWGGVNSRLLIKLCCGLSLLLILVIWFDVASVARQLFAIDAFSVMIAVGLLTLQFLLSCARWIYILGRQGQEITPRNALAVFGAGTLANLFLVTSVAGISARVALLVRAGADMPGALASVTAERLAAGAGLAACAALGLAFGLPELRSYFSAWNGGGFDVALLMILTAAALGGVAVLRNTSALRRFIGILWLTFSSARSAVLLTFVSSVSILLGFAGTAVLARGMGLEIDPVFFISVMPLIAFISALPISVGGWGVREGTMVAGLAAFSVPADSAMALSISYGLAGLLVAFTMGVVLTLCGTGSLCLNSDTA